MNLLDVILLSILEGITEFLPISSTGHLILASEVLRIPSTEFVKTFEIVIQLGAILAVVVLYTKRVLQSLSIIPKLLTAFAPTAVIGLLLYDVIKQYLFETPLLVASMLLLGGIALIGIELYFKGKDAPKYSEKSENQKTGKSESQNIRKSASPILRFSDSLTHRFSDSLNTPTSSRLSVISYKQAFFIGCFQSLSIVPGVSRAASTIFGGLFMKLDRRTAVEFSFLLAIPTMIAASGLDLLKSGTHFTSQEYLQLGIGTLIAFITALLVIKWLLKYIQNHSFIPFGVYRIILALIFLLFLLG